MTFQTLSEALSPFSKSQNPNPLHHIGTRYDAKGTFLLEPGNTIVCHLLGKSLSAEAVIDARTRMQTFPEAEKLAFTDVSSLHMTVFQGIIEYRRALPYWPEDIPLDTAIDTMTEAFLVRLQKFEVPDAFKMEVIGASPNGLTLGPLTSKDARILKIWRDKLADCFGYRHPDHEKYEFHITFAYLLERFSDEALLDWQRGLADLIEELQERAPVIELEPPAFCRFKDMNHFEKLLVLS